LTETQTELSIPEALDAFARTGSTCAFDQLVNAYRGDVMNVCRRMLRNEHDAEDAAQAVFLTLAMQVRAGVEIHLLRAWLLKVARHVCLDMIKARKRRTRHEDAARVNRDLTMPAMTSADVSMDRCEMRSALERQLQLLPTKYRTPMVLFYFGGFSLQQIAGQLGVSAKALGVRLMRGRRMLAESMARGAFPWASVAIAPALVAETIRSGSLTPANIIHGGADVAVVNLFGMDVANRVARLFGRRVLTAMALIAATGASAGSASMLNRIATGEAGFPSGYSIWNQLRTFFIPEWKLPVPVLQTRADEQRPGTTEPTIESNIASNTSPRAPLRLSPPPANMPKSGDLFTQWGRRDAQNLAPPMTGFAHASRDSATARSHDAFTLTPIDAFEASPAHDAASSASASQKHIGRAKIVPVDVGKVTDAFASSAVPSDAIAMFDASSEMILPPSNAGNLTVRVAMPVDSDKASADEIGSLNLVSGSEVTLDQFVPGEVIFSDSGLLKLDLPFWPPPEVPTTSGAASSMTEPGVFNPIPEPTALGLLVLGATALLRRRRRNATSA